MLYGMALLFIYLPTELAFLQNGLGLTSLNGNQWLFCIGLALALLIIYEIMKVFLRSSHRKHDPATPAVAVPARV